jgi:type II secretory ATPase GspE/PulE/Tfp pilus assembly ATPase PilB-like protein
MDTGFVGRTGLFETLTFDEELRRCVSRGDDANQLSRLAHERNLIHDLRTDAAWKVKQGETTAEEAASAVIF